MNTVNETLTNCMDCKAHKVIADPDPHDWFNIDDEAVLCTLTEGNPSYDQYSLWASDQQSQHRCITSMCRPYQKRAECEIPDWCPKLPKKTPQQIMDEKTREALEDIRKR